MLNALSQLKLNHPDLLQDLIVMSDDALGERKNLNWKNSYMQLVGSWSVCEFSGFNFTTA